MSNHDELPEVFDPSAHGGTSDFVPIPIGWYQAQIIENEVCQAKNGNGSYLLAIFEILDGEFRGRKIYQNVTLQNANQQAVEIGQHLLTDIYSAIGHTEPTRDIRVMLFKPVMVRVGIKRDSNGEYADRNCVNSVRPPNFQPKSGRGIASPPRGPSPKPPAAAAAASPNRSAPWRE